MEEQQQIKISFEIVNKYYEALRYSNEYFNELLKKFIEEYPEEYKHLNKIHHKRCIIRNNFEALKSTGNKIYFGTLTYDETKDRNNETYKREEAFRFLNTCFEFFLLVEEKGEENGRYHCHFIGTFKEDKDFEDFRKWHSRQNLQEVLLNEEDKKNYFKEEEVKTENNEKKVVSYLCKYVSKQIPRIRRNKALVRLEKAYKTNKPLKRTFKTTFKSRMKENVEIINIFDL